MKNEKLTYFLLLILLAAVSQAADPLYIDFTNAGGNVQRGYQAYYASHENPGTFTPQDFSAFGTSVTVIPAWAPDATAAAMQMIVHNSSYSGTYADLLDDWIGTDARQPGNPMTLTISGLPVGSYSWSSFHHDLNDQTGQFDVTIYDASGEQTISSVDITNGTDVMFDNITKLSAVITSNGTDDIRFVFSVVSSTSNVSTAFFVMNGFELQGNDVCYNSAPQVEGSEAPLAIAGKPVAMDVTVNENSRPYIEGCDPNNPLLGTAYSLEFQWLQQSGPETALFDPLSADQQAVAVTFPLQGMYKLSLDVSDAPVDVQL